MIYIDGKAYKKTEAHVHLAPVSVCGHMDAEEASAKLAACGYEAAVLTNHYSRAYIDVHSSSEKEWRERYLENFHLFREVGARHGLEVFFGAEVTLQAIYTQSYRGRWSDEFIENNFADYLIYGMTEEMFVKTPLLCDFTLPELRKICAEYGALIVQAHPFRTEQQHSLRDVRLLDGLELNSHRGFPSGPHEAEILRLARGNGLVVTCGGDLHTTAIPWCSAMYLPADIHDSVALAAYLKEMRIPRYSLDEPDPVWGNHKTV